MTLLASIRHRSRRSAIIDDAPGNVQRISHGTADYKSAIRAKPAFAYDESQSDTPSSTSIRKVADSFSPLYFPSSQPHQDVPNRTPLRKKRHALPECNYERSLPFHQTDSNERFNYKECPINTKLKQIRVLHVHKAVSYDDPIEATIKVRDLHHKPLYNAMSYTWGSEGSLSEIRLAVNGSQQFRLFKIRRNLEDMLKWIRTKDGDAKVWIDAICIDQQDDFEKREQIGVMREIFSEAWEVWIYLGGLEPGLDMSKQEMQHLLNGMMAEGRQAYSQKLSRLIHHILQNPWFTRVWIIQEATAKLTSRVIVDGLEFPLLSFLEVATVRGKPRDLQREWFYFLHQLANPPWIGACTIYKLLLYTGSFPAEKRRKPRNKFFETTMTRRQFRELANKCIYEDTDLQHEIDETGRAVVQYGAVKLIDLLCELRMFAASVPVDKIYAIRNLATDHEQTPEISYGVDHLPVFIDFAKYFVRSGQGNSLLHAASSFVQHKDLPSWVPDWSSPKAKALSIDRVLEAYVRAGAQQDMLMSVGRGGRHLLIEDGVVADTVKYTERSQGLKQGRGVEEIKKELEQLCTLHRIGRFSNLIGLLQQDRLSDIHWSVPESAKADIFPLLLDLLAAIIAEQDEAGKQSNASSSHRLSSNCNDKTFRGDEDPVQRLFANVLREDARWPCIESCDSHVEFHLLQHRQLCITEEYRLGLVPRDARPGDRIMVFPGAVTPHIIRQRDSGNYELVGDCYVRGLMHGRGLLLGYGQTIVLE
ncbi:heterokaryon incompatibility protein-domain-containing protein [Phyllosticta capitalensis]